MKPSFVSVEQIQYFQVRFRIYHGLQLNFVRRCLVGHHLEHLVDGSRQVKEIIRDIELIVLHLGQVKQIINEVLHHFLRINLRL